MTDEKLMDEAGRLAALGRYEVLDTPKEAGFDRITHLVKAVMNVPICSVTLIDSDRQWFKSCVGIDIAGTPRKISFCTHTIQQREPMHIPDATLDPRFQENPAVRGEPFIRSYLGAPLCTPDGYNVGTLCVLDKVARPFTPEQITVLESFASIVVDELELRRIAYTDHLTGALSRRNFYMEMEKAMSRYQRSGTSAAVVMLDIDRFKGVNDTYGHPVGDLVLKAATERLRSKLRPYDLMGRLGGEEFGLLLQEIDLKEATEAAERLCGLLADTQLIETPPISISASFGVAALERGIDSANAWLALADQALYEAKRGGRNRVSAAVTDRQERLSV
jgi:diguanylate cyclase (GGDEF)-like protein